MHLKAPPPPFSSNFNSPSVFTPSQNTLVPPSPLLSPLPSVVSAPLCLSTPPLLLTSSHPLFQNHPRTPTHFHALPRTSVRSRSFLSVFAPPFVPLASGSALYVSGDSPETFRDAIPSVSSNSRSLTLSRTSPRLSSPPLTLLPRPCPVSSPPLCSPLTSHPSPSSSPSPLVKEKSPSLLRQGILPFLTTTTPLSPPPPPPPLASQPSTTSLVPVLFLSTPPLSLTTQKTPPGLTKLFIVYLRSLTSCVCKKLNF